MLTVLPAVLSGNPPSDSLSLPTETPENNKWENQNINSLPASSHADMGDFPGWSLVQWHISQHNGQTGSLWVEPGL